MAVNVIDHSLVRQLLTSQHTLSSVSGSDHVKYKRNSLACIEMSAEQCSCMIYFPNIWHVLLFGLFMYRLTTLRMIKITSQQGILPCLATSLGQCTVVCPKIRHNVQIFVLFKPIGLYGIINAQKYVGGVRIFFSSSAY